ncbi:MAG: nitroreductase family protein, partial [Chloroflexota bacterium]|nr:nitroreductase family protein [Chloroflexota bacterium]
MHIQPTTTKLATATPDFWQFVQGRRSIRRYQAQLIDPALLTQLLEAATWAPSAHNRQPWRFCVITSSEAKHALSARMADYWRADLGSDGADPALIERRVAISHARLTGAAALVVASVSMEEMDIYPDVRRSTAEWTMAVQSVALA